MSGCAGCLFRAQAPAAPAYHRWSVPSRSPQQASTGQRPSIPKPQGCRRGQRRCSMRTRAAADEMDESASPEEVEEWLHGHTKDWLSDELQSRNIKKSGSKADIVDRLLPVMLKEQQQARQTGNAPPRRSSQQHPEVDIVSGATAGQGDNSQAQAGLMDIPQPAASSHAEPSTAQALEGADTQQGTAESGGQDDAEEDEEEFDEEEDEDEEEEEDDDLDAAAQSYEEDEEDEDLDDTVVSQQRPDSPGKQPLDAATRPSEPMTELPSNPPQAQPPRDPSAILDSGDTVDEEDAPQGIELIGHHEDVSNLLKAELQEQLRARGLSDQGKKGSLVNRLREAQQREALSSAGRSNPSSGQSYKVPKFRPTMEGGSEQNGAEAQDAEVQDPQHEDEGEEDEEEVSYAAEDHTWYWRIDDSERNPHFEPSRMDILGMTADYFSSPRAD